MKRIKIVLIIVFALIMLLLSACGQEDNADAFTVEIKCESAEVYRIFYSTYIDGQYYGMGAVADQDGRVITSDMVLKTVLTRSYFENSDITLLSMDFSPYGENDSYEMETTNKVEFEAEYGKTYTVIISGDKESGFRAEVQK